MNPASGTADRKRAEAIRARAEAAGLDTLSIAPGLDVGTEIRSRIDRGERLFLAAGGDGTIHTVIQHLVGTEGELGVLPAGTWNHFARDIGMPMNWETAFDMILNGTRAQVDVGRANDRFFVNNLSLGIYPEMVQHREQLRHQGKWRAYWKAFRSALKTFPKLALGIETSHMMETVRTQVFMVSVNAYDLDKPGILAPRKSLAGGMLGVYWLREMPKLDFIITVARYLRGKSTEEGAIRSVMTTAVKVQSSRRALRAGMDGELHEVTLPLQVSIVRCGLNVRIPRNPVR